MRTSDKAQASAEPATPQPRRDFVLLRFLADRAPSGARVPEICQHLKVHRVSAHRILKSLIGLGYVEQAPDLSYHLGFEAWSLGLAASRRFLPSSIKQTMKRVADESEECVFLMRRAGKEGVCIARQEGTYPVQSLVMKVGTRRLLGVGGTSLAILANLPDEEAEVVIRQNAKEYLRFGISERDVRRFVAETQAHGFSYSAGVVVAESRTIAVPIVPSVHTPTAMSLSIVTIEPRLQEPRRSEMVRLLQREAAVVVKALT